MTTSALDTVTRLIALATDPAALQSHEAENAGRRLAHLIKDHGLAVVEASQAAPPSPTVDLDLWLRWARAERELEYWRNWAHTLEDERRKTRAA
jgi:hypothetical protein